MTHYPGCVFSKLSNWPLKPAAAREPIFWTSFSTCRQNMLFFLSSSAFATSFFNVAARPSILFLTLLKSMLEGQPRARARGISRISNSCRWHTEINVASWALRPYRLPGRGSGLDLRFAAAMRDIKNGVGEEGRSSSQYGQSVDGSTDESRNTKGGNIMNGTIENVRMRDSQESSINVEGLSGLGTG